MQDLQGDVRALILIRQPRRCGGETASGALAADTQPGTVPAVVSTGDPAHDVVDLLRRSRKTVPRRQDVAGVDHKYTRVGRQVAAPGVVLFGMPDHEAAAVDVDIDRSVRRGRRWTV